MESTERFAAFWQWLQKVARSEFNLTRMLGDASFRRYYRLHFATHTLIGVDVPLTENCQPFIAIANALRQQGIFTPEIIAADLNQGFLLVSDFGDTTYLKALNTHNANLLYDRALQTLVRIQACRTTADHPLPIFSAQLMWQEMRWYQEWFLQKLLQLPPIFEDNPIFQCLAKLIAAATEQPQVFMHRDYHSANLMLLAKAEVGVLDFQDAFIGPLTYDVVSLLKDCYISWPKEQVTAWATLYWQKFLSIHPLPISQQQFLRWFDWMGVERHLKALFTFARKAVRDHERRYLQHVPRTLHYVLETSRRYEELMPLHDYLVAQVLPAIKKY